MLSDHGGPLLVFAGAVRSQLADPTTLPFCERIVTLSNAVFYPLKKLLYCFGCERMSLHLQRHTEEELNEHNECFFDGGIDPIWKSI